MRDHLSLGPTPADETCAATVDPDYWDRAPREIEQYRLDVIERHGPPPAGCRLHCHREPGGNGGYLELCAAYEADDPEAMDYAYTVEADLPMEWSARARVALALGEKTTPARE